MPPIPIPFLTLVFAIIIFCCLSYRTTRESYEHEIEDLRLGSSRAITDLITDTLILILRYKFMKACLSVDDPRIRGLGPLPYESKTFHINEGVTLDQVERIVELLQQVQHDLDRDFEVVNTFWEKWVRTNGNMARDEVTRGVQLMTEWRDGKKGAAARELMAEAQNYFGMDDGIEAEGFTTEQLKDQLRIRGWRIAM